MSDPNLFDEPSQKNRMRRKSSNSRTARVIHPNELQNLLKTQKATKKNKGNQKQEQQSPDHLSPPPFEDELSAQTPAEPLPQPEEPTPEPESSVQPTLAQHAELKEPVKTKSLQNRKKPPRVQRDWSELKTNNTEHNELENELLSKSLDSTEKILGPEAVEPRLKSSPTKKPKKNEGTAESQSKAKPVVKRKPKHEPKINLVAEPSSVLNPESTSEITPQIINKENTPSNHETPLKPTPESPPPTRRRLPRSKPFSATPQNKKDNIAVNMSEHLEAHAIPEADKKNKAKKKPRNKTVKTSDSGVAVELPPFADKAPNSLSPQNIEHTRFEPHLEPHLEPQAETTKPPIQTTKVEHSTPIKEEITVTWVTLMPWWGLSLLWIAIDQFSKLWVQSRIQLGTMVEVIPNFNMVHILNPGAAFSFLASHSGWQRYFLSGIAIIASVVIVFMMRSAQNRMTSLFFLSSILGGALGNLLDRLMHGAVIDFLDFYIAGYHWPAFNIADVAITVGAVGLIVDELFFTHKRSR